MACIILPRIDSLPYEICIPLHFFAHKVDLHVAIGFLVYKMLDRLLCQTLQHVSQLCGVGLAVDNTMN